MNFYTHVATRGSKILFRGIENGKRVSRAEPFYPTLFVVTESQSKYKTIHGQFVKAISPGNLYETREFIDSYKDVSGFEIYGDMDPVYQYISKNYPNEIEFDPNQIRVGYIDIETKCENGFPNVTTANEEIIAITVKIGDETTVFGVGNFHIFDENHECVKFQNERDMLEHFLGFWKEIDLDIITGWNVNFFDIPYLVNRYRNLFGEDIAKELSPWKSIRERKVEIMGRMAVAYELLGRVTLDYFELYKKFTFVNRESYKLDHIAEVELGEKKVSYAEYDTIQEFYTKNFQKFMEYNVKDVHLVAKLEEKLKLLELAMTMGYMAKSNLNDVFSQVRLWDVLVYNELISNNIVVPKKKTGEKTEQFVGAYVKEPQVGRHKWVVSFDINSLYPSNIILLNLGPDTITQDGVRGSVNIDSLLESVDKNIEERKSRGICTAANGTTYRTDFEGFLPKLMKKLYNERKVYKKKMLDASAELKKLQETGANSSEIKRLKTQISVYETKQQAFKVTLNSCFGALGNQYFRHYDLRLAEAITFTGQYVIRFIQNKLNEFLNKTIGTTDVDYVIASDTDSIYIRMDELVKKSFSKEPTEKEVLIFLDKACDKIIQPIIDKNFDRLTDTIGGIPDSLQMKRECIADVGIWTAKKRYMLNVVMGEDGVVLETPEQKIMGIESTRSSTPKVVREALKDCVQIIMNGDEKQIQDYVKKFRKTFDELPVEDIAFPRSCNNIQKYTDNVRIYSKGCPIAVKGSLLYNEQIKKNSKLMRKYQLIREGEKIKFVHMKTPNPIGNHVFSFPTVLPPELGLHKYVDRKDMFEKSFLVPLNAILSCIGWTAEKTTNLESFFI
jgi:DNA polymerase elongation subunit (family B)